MSEIDDNMKQEAEQQAIDEINEQPSLAEILKALPRSKTVYTRRGPSIDHSKDFYPPADSLDDYGSHHPPVPPKLTKDKMVTITLSAYQLYWLQWRLHVHLNSYAKVEWVEMKAVISELVTTLGDRVTAICRGEE